MNLIPSSNFPSCLSNSNRQRQLGPENDVPLAMRRVPAKIIPKFQSSSAYPKSTMASDGTRVIQSVDLQKKCVDVEEKEKKEKSTKSLPTPPPPPPEKPLPGDCCGSGCVRCVWDVYYEELEAYNKICEKDLKAAVAGGQLQKLLASS